MAGLGAAAGPGDVGVTHDVVPIASAATGVGRTVGLGFVLVVAAIVGVLRR